MGKDQVRPVHSRRDKVMEDNVKTETGSWEDNIQYAELRLRVFSSDILSLAAIIKSLLLIRRNRYQGGGKAKGHFTAEKQEQSFGEQAMRDVLTGIHNKAGERAD